MQLSEKQKRFCEEYLVDLNGTQAAIRAGYAKGSAVVQASRLLTNDNVASYVRELRELQKATTLITADYVLAGLKEVAERSLQRVPVMDWDYEKKEPVQKTDEEGNNIWVFEANGANRAFELLGKHVGIFERDNSQKQANITVYIDD